MLKQKSLIVDGAILNHVSMQAIYGVQDKVSIEIGFSRLDGHNRLDGKAKAVGGIRLYGILKNAVYPEVPGRKPPPPVRLCVVDELSGVRLVSFENLKTGEKWP